MTWQLVRRDPAWQLMPWLVLVAAAVCVGSHFIFAPAGRNWSADFVHFQLLFLPFAIPHALVTQRDETRFQATLPVTVRQVFLSRMISVVAMIWLPVIASVAMLAALRDPFAS